MQASLQFTPEQVIGTQKYGRYTIYVYDDSGNPTNGNNVQVAYQQVTYGVYGPVQYATISGMSKIIFDGVVQDDSTQFITYFVLTGTLIPGTPSPPTTPDLKIISIDVTHKADSAGNNGKVTINATSSFQPIQYYIDDVLQSGNYDLTVTAGNHIAKVTDASDTEVTQPFTVLKLDSLLYSDPSKTTGGYISRWSAAYNPIVFEYHRKDYDVTGIDQDTTTLKPKIAVNTDMTNIAIGDYVYLDAGLTNGLSTYKGSFKVLSKIGTGTIVIDTDYVATTTIAGFMNSDTLKPYYKVITKIKYVDPATGLFNTIISTNRTINAIVRADLSSFLQSILNPQPDQSNYTAVNYRDMGLAASYQISFAETWEGNTPVYTDIATPFYVTYAAMQLQQAYGGNMFAYVTQPGGVHLAKWITDFLEPSYSTSFPFDLSFIYSEQIAGRQLYYKIILLDINRNPLGTNEYTSFLLNEDSTFLLNNDGSKLVIAWQQLVNTPIAEHIGLNRLLFNQDFGPECYYLKVALFYNNSGIASRFNYDLTETGTVRSDIIIYDNDAEVAHAIFTGNSGAVNISPGNTYLIRAISDLVSGSNPTLTLTIKKNGVTIFAQTITTSAGAHIDYTGTSDVNAVYDIEAVSMNDGVIVTPVNIPDDPDVPLNEVPVTENIIVKVDKVCANNWVYLRWIGLTGSWNYYRFNYNQTKTLDIQNPVIIKDYVSDWENGEGIERVVSKDAGPKTQLYADALSRDDIDGMRALKAGCRVQMLMSKSPIKWQTIVVNSSTFTEYDTQNEFYEFGITFSTPSLNLQSQ